MKVFTGVTDQESWGYIPFNQTSLVIRNREWRFNFSDLKCFFFLSFWFHPSHVDTPTFPLLCVFPAMDNFLAVAQACCHIYFAAPKPSFSCTYVSFSNNSSSFVA